MKDFQFKLNLNVSKFKTFPRVPSLRRENWYTATLENERFLVKSALPTRNCAFRILQNAHIYRKFGFFQKSYQFATVRKFEKRLGIISKNT